ncbi:MAG: cytochrome c peroxidase [Pseudomonadota bacterium]
MGALRTAVRAAITPLWLGLALAGQTATGSEHRPDFSASERAIIAGFGPLPTETPPDPGNELSGRPWAEALGAALFRDPRLSGGGQLACITCHQPVRGFSDGLPVALGAARHTRNTQGLLGVGLQRWFGRDGGADSLWAASLRPMLSPLEMAATSDSVAARMRDDEALKAAAEVHASGLGLNLDSDTDITVFIAKALGAYLRTLASPRTPFDDFRVALLDGDTDAIARYPAAAQRGLKHFVGEARCFVCHVGPAFSNGEFHDIGRPFFTGVGEVDGGRYLGIKRVRRDPFNLLGEHAKSASDAQKRKTSTVTLGQVNFGQWRTPSLRNLLSTAPYMHDGSLASLAAVVDYYADIDADRLHSDGESLLRPLPLSDTDRADLVHFLETLSTAPAR